MKQIGAWGGRGTERESDWGNRIGGIGLPGRAIREKAGASMPRAVRRQGRPSMGRIGDQTTRRHGFDDVRRVDTEHTEHTHVNVPDEFR